MTDPDCLFCRIAAGEIPAKRVYEDDTCIAFLDISPWQKGHTLVIPRRHVPDALADDRVLAEVSPSVVAVARLLQERLDATACNILTNAGPDSGQEVFHAHVHVIPRYPENPGIANLRGEFSESLDDVFETVTRRR